MGELVLLKMGGDAPIIDTIRIDQNKQKVSFELSLFQFTDKDTQQIVQYLPTLEITSYGDTQAEVAEMLNSCVNEFLTQLGDLSQKHLQAELRKMGWKQVALKHKKFSKAFVDLNGELQNFNTVDDKVERLALTA